MLTKEEISLEKENLKLSTNGADNEINAENFEAVENLSTQVNQNLAEE